MEEPNIQHFYTGTCNALVFCFSMVLLCYTGACNEVTSGLIQSAPIELKFDTNDPEVNLKIPRVNSRSLRGHYEVNSGLIQNAPIELIFYMNNPFVILHMLNYSRGHSRS